MKKTGRLISLLFIMFFSVSAACFANKRYSVDSEKINVRSGPGTKYEVLWQAERNYPMNVVKEKGKWVRFKDFEGYEGWVYKPLLNNKSSVVVKVKKSNVRKGPGINYPVVFTAEKGTPFLVIEQKNGWYKLLHSDGDSGWAKKSLLW